MLDSFLEREPCDVAGAFVFCCQRRQISPFVWNTLARPLLAKGALERSALEVLRFVERAESVLWRLRLRVVELVLLVEEAVGEGG